MGVGSRITYYTITGYVLLIHLAWCLIEIALAAQTIHNDVAVTNTDGTVVIPNTDAINLTSYEYAWCQIFAITCIAVCWFSERYPLSRAAALTAFTVTTVVVFSWLPIHLRYVYYTLQQTGPNYHTGFCLSTPIVYTSICQLTFGVAVLSIMHVTSLWLLWLLSLYQIARSESAPKLHAAERLTQYSIYTILLGSVVWSLASVVLNTDLNAMAFSRYLVSDNYLQGYIWAIIIAATGSAAWISYGATKGSKFLALMVSILLFTTITPFFVYDVHGLQYCTPVGPSIPTAVTNWHCDATAAMVAGEGIVTVASFVLLMSIAYLYYLVTDSAETWMPLERHNTQKLASPQRSPNHSPTTDHNDNVPSTTRSNEHAHIEMAHANHTGLRHRGDSTHPADQTLQV